MQLKPKKMKWNDIRGEYPKAWKVFCEHFDIIIGKSPKEFNNWIVGSSQGIHYLRDNDPECGMHFQVRNLYDFFDKNKIYISMEIEVQYTREVDEDGKNPHYVPEGLHYAIHDESHQLGFAGVFEHRGDAEESAFTDAFKFLEERL